MSFQTLYGMLTLSHSDIAALNVMMDGRALYPGGHHPASIESSPDLYEELVPLLRIDNPVRYLYVDFGLSVRFQPGASTHVVGNVGRDAEVPELSSTVPYDAYKADIYALGNLFDKELVQVSVRVVTRPRVISYRYAEIPRRRLPEAPDRLHEATPTRVTTDPR